MKAMTFGVVAALALGIAAPAFAQDMSHNVPDPNGPTTAASSATAMETTDPHMSKSKMATMKRCQAMSPTMAMRNKKCAAMMPPADRNR